MGVCTILAGVAVTRYFYVHMVHKPAKNHPSLQQIPAPTMNDVPIFKVRFETSLGTVTNGKAFLAKDTQSGSVWLFSAHSLIGRAGGLSKDVSWKKLAQTVQRAICTPQMPGLETLTFQELVVIKGARAVDAYSGANDLLVFKVPPDYERWAIPISLEPLKPGAPVWLMDQVSGGSGMLHLGKFTEESYRWLQYTYLDSIDPKNSIGAPIINQRGELVALNLGGHVYNGRHGFGNSAKNINKLLANLP